MFPISYILLDLALLCGLSVTAQSPTALTLFGPEPKTTQDVRSFEFAFFPIGTGASDTTYEGVQKAIGTATVTAAAQVLTLGPATVTQTYVVSASGFSQLGVVSTAGVRVQVDSVCTIDGKGGVGCVVDEEVRNSRTTTVLKATTTGKAKEFAGPIVSSRGALNNNGAYGNYRTSMAALSGVIGGILLGVFNVF